MPCSQGRVGCLFPRERVVPTQPRAETSLLLTGDGHPGMHGPARAVLGGSRAPLQLCCTAQTHPYLQLSCTKRQDITAEQERRKTSIWQEGSCLASWPGTQAEQENVHWKKQCLKDIWEDRLLSPVFLLSVITSSIK